MNEKKLLTFGIHAVEALLKKQPERITCLMVLRDRQDKKIQAITEFAKQKRIRVEHYSRQELDRLVDDGNH